MCAGTFSHLLCICPVFSLVLSQSFIYLLLYLEKRFHTRLLLFLMCLFLFLCVSLHLVDSTNFLSGLLLCFSHNRPRRSSWNSQLLIPVTGSRTSFNSCKHNTTGADSNTDTHRHKREKNGCILHLAWLLQLRVMQVSLSTSLLQTKPFAAEIHKGKESFVSLDLLWRYLLQALLLDAAHTVLRWPLLYPIVLVLILFQMALLFRDQIKAKGADTFISLPLQTVLSMVQIV